MDDWKIVILSGGVSLFSAIITAVLSQFFTHRNNTKSLILEKRSELYFEVYDVIDSLINNRSQVYDIEYINTLIKYKAKMKLLSSKTVIEEYKDFFNFVTQHYKNYITYYNQNNPNNDDKWLEPNVDGDGEVVLVPMVPDSIEVGFRKSMDRYKTENLPELQDIYNHVEILYKAMREDLGSNIK